jgi:hypothetical protein
LIKNLVVKLLVTDRLSLFSFLGRDGSSFGTAIFGWQSVTDFALDQLGNLLLFFTNTTTFSFNFENSNLLNF